MNGATLIDDKNRRVVIVLLTCISCGAVEEIHVFEERRIPAKIYWECFGCQKHEPRTATRPGTV